MYLFGKAQWWLLIGLIQHAWGSTNYKLTSVYYGNEGWSMNEIGSLSSWTGKCPTTVLLFTDWCNASMPSLFNSQLNNIWNNQSIPVITWELFECAGSSRPGIIRSVVNNSYDSYINDFGNRLKLWLSGVDGILGNADDRRVYLRLAHEMNGNWYPWSSNSTPQDYVLGWRHVHDILTNKGLDATRLQWIWCVNNADVGSYTAENYWVGDGYADWLGIDGYNFGASQSSSTWLSPRQVFDSMIARLRTLSASKPICINEYATTSIITGNVSDIQSKNAWLTQLCAYIDEKEIKMASCFNSDKETDWAIFHGVRGNVVWNNITAYTAYKDCLQSNDWITPDQSNPRIITDAQFSGRTSTTTLLTTTRASRGFLSNIPSTSLWIAALIITCKLIQTSSTI